jgi:hypothetical protein
MLKVFRDRKLEHVPATLNEVFCVFPQLQGKCQGIIEKGARPASPNRGGIRPK